ncbi:hypothetical protein C7974DRAFT_127031 [Boeremia exigua]|uniref:uncharacterized protein n=1 Tax=Boeremia exigua TaxID=749465 RepID=UPI001E8DADD9|nr:uncharacterized protein C7974DRAFT_127031 [Boeremia exigua]KAH6639166.1 hypothetical protein C7974DRAFT_127031 [Boeremia exigua]
MSGYDHQSDSASNSDDEDDLFAASYLAGPTQTLTPLHVQGTNAHPLAPSAVARPRVSLSLLDLLHRRPSLLDLLHRRDRRPTLSPLQLPHDSANADPSDEEGANARSHHRGAYLPSRLAHSFPLYSHRLRMRVLRDSPASSSFEEDMVKKDVEAVAETETKTEKETDTETAEANTKSELHTAPDTEPQPRKHAQPDSNPNPNDQPANQNDHIRALLIPILPALLKLKSTTPPPYSPHVRTKSLAQILKQRMLPVGRHVQALLRGVEEGKRGALELDVCEYIAARYWPSAAGEGGRLRVLEGLRNAVYLEGLEESREGGGAGEAGAGGGGAEVSDVISAPSELSEDYSGKHAGMRGG